MSSSEDGERILVGVHFSRHFGGPGHLVVGPGEVTLTNRRGTRTVTQAARAAGVVRLERKRWEPPGTNRWLHLSDGETTAWATMSRRRAERVTEALTRAGFSVEVV